MNRSSRTHRENRGLLRGFFVLAVLVHAGCEKEVEQTPPPPQVVEAPDASAPAADAEPERAALPDAAPQAPQIAAALDLPWKKPFPSFDELKRSLPEEPIGTVSGDVYGQNRPVYAIAKTQCGAGVLLQVIYRDDEERLAITPGIPLRFFDLPTGRRVTYEDSYLAANFEITLDLQSATSERFAGSIDIDVVEPSESKYIDLDVDGPAIDGLFLPRMYGEGRVPEFTACAPTGYLEVVDDGTAHRGYVNLLIDEASGTVVAKPLLTAGAGLELAVGRRSPTATIADSGKIALADARKPGEGQDFVIFASAFNAPELLPADKATGMNVGREQTTKLRDGTAQFSLQKNRGKWYLDLVLEDVRVPELIEGPLRGRTLDVVRVHGWANAGESFPDGPGDPPDWWKTNDSGAATEE